MTDQELQEAVKAIQGSKATVLVIDPKQRLEVKKWTTSDDAATLTLDQFTQDFESTIK